MKSKHDPDAALDQTLAGIRDEAIDPSVTEKAGARVWARLSLEKGSSSSSPAPVSAPPERIRTCADVQSLLPAYLKGTLSPARALLVQDHTRECVPCRRALLEARSGVTARVRPTAVEATGRPRVLRWAIAASILVTVVIGWSARPFRIRPRSTPSGEPLQTPTPRLAVVPRRGGSCRCRR